MTIVTHEPKRGITKVKDSLEAIPMKIKEIMAIMASIRKCPRPPDMTATGKNSPTKIMAITLKTRNHCSNFSNRPKSTETSAIMTDE